MRALDRHTEMREYHNLLRATSRTFAVGIEALPNPLRDAVTLAYLVLRVSDYFEDSPTLAVEAKRRALEMWATMVARDTESASDTDSSREAVGVAEGVRGAAAIAQLLGYVSPADGDLPDRKAALEAGAILEGVARLPSALRRPIREHTAATTHGMARWAVRGDDFPDESALDDYMFEVAGRVGLLLTDLFCAHSPRIQGRRDALLETAVSFGLGLQTVNVIRGLHEDPDRGWTYVPRHVLPETPGAPGLEHGASTLTQLGPEAQARILEFLIAKAGTHLEDALQYCRTIPRRSRGIRMFCIIPALLALRTAEISRGNPATFTEPVRVPRAEVVRIVAMTRWRFFSDRWIRGWEARARRLGEGSEHA